MTEPDVTVPRGVAVARLRVFAVVGVLACAMAPALGAQQSVAWRLHADAGFATIHGSDAGVLVSAMVARDLDAAGVTRATAAGGWGSSDEGFGFVEGGVEWHPPPIGPLDPFLNGSLGIISEPEFTGGLLRVGVGFDVAMGAVAAFRVQGRVGVHSDEAGPHGATVGVVVRLP